MPERARIVTNGGSQTIELPETCRFPEGEREVLVRREGKKLILEPVIEPHNGWTAELLSTFGAWDDEIELPPQRPITETKDPFE